MKFAPNSATDMLPHKSNLSLWRGLNDSCKLCGEKQTLSHVLNHYEVALKLHRYNHGHDEVLSVIATFISSHLPPSYQMTSDTTSSYHLFLHFAHSAFYASVCYNNFSYTTYIPLHLMLMGLLVLYQLQCFCKTLVKQDT